MKELLSINQEQTMTSLDFRNIVNEARLTGAVELPSVLRMS